jgi:hypothetical protein
MTETMIRKGTILCAALLLFVAPSCGPSKTSEEPQPGRVHHIVLCWLKDPGNGQHIETLIDQTRSFSSRPGVVSVAAGTSLASDRPVVDDTFDVGIIMTFESEEALAAYLADPEHRKATEEVMRPLVERLVIYDVVDGRVQGVVPQ